MLLVFSDSLLFCRFKLKKRPGKRNFSKPTLIIEQFGPSVTEEHNAAADVSIHNKSEKV